MSEEKNVANKILQVLQFLLPFAITFVGWYVSTVVAPLDRELKYHINLTKDYGEKIIKLETKYDDVFRRLSICEYKAEKTNENLFRREFDSQSRSEIKQIIRDYFKNVPKHN